MKTRFSSSLVPIGTFPKHFNSFIVSGKLLILCQKFQTDTASVLGVDLGIEH